MRMCHLEEVECEFSGMGCEERPRREDQEEHTRQSTQKHIALTATATIKTREVVQLKLDDKVQTLHTTIEFCSRSFRTKSNGLRSARSL